MYVSLEITYKTFYIDFASQNNIAFYSSVTYKRLKISKHLFIELFEKTIITVLLFETFEIDFGRLLKRYYFELQYRNKILQD